jgi:hypothetical protein
MSARRKKHIAETLELVEVIEHACGVVEERFNDGSRNFSGGSRGDGVLVLHASGKVTLLPVTKRRKNSTDNTELLLAVAWNMPPRPLELADLANYKHEALVMLEALRFAMWNGDAGFFRSLAELIQPAGSKVEARKEQTKNRQQQINYALGPLANAAEKIGGCPWLKAVALAGMGDKTKSSNAGMGDKSESSKSGTRENSDMLKALRNYGFGWIKNVPEGGLPGEKR